MRAGAAGLALGVLALMVGAAPVTAAPATATAAGTDLVSIALNKSALALRVRDAAQAGRGLPGHDPAAVLLGPAGGSAGRVPAGQNFAFLGEPGHPVWSLSSGDNGFPQLDTTGVRRGATIGDVVEVSLRAVDGPGRFTAYTLSSLGVPTPLFGTGPDAPDTARLPAATRAGSLIWMFDAAGEHRVTLAASVTLPSGEKASTQESYRVQVPTINPGPTAPLPAPALSRPAAPDESGAPRTSAAASGTSAKPAAAPRALTAPAAKVAAPTTAAGRKVIADGHVDMGPQLTGDAWIIRIKDDTVSPPVWRELSDVVLHVKDTAKVEVPAGADFLGKPGDAVWLLPQAQQSGIVWPGWNTQHESVVAGTKGNVTWALKGVTGPGRFTLFLTGSFGKADVLFDSAKALPQQMSVPPNTHAHGNWAFSKPGLYRLAVQMSATTTAGKAVTDTKTLTIAVGDATDPGSGSGSGSGNGGAGTGSDTGSGPLPRTGAGWVLTAVGGGGTLVAVGALLLVAARRRRHTGPTGAESA
ncbi:TIGR03773 family transporter-associated surface protein [Micromonospora sp. NPDC094482]|uniref:TIGR03773 family transporter-associated surface protein n=1 Tax=unclassified Micromonospora TaxID=2617518 RepID=UPI00331A2D4E